MTGTWLDSVTNRYTEGPNDAVTSYSYSPDHFNDLDTVVDPNRKVWQSTHDDYGYLKTSSNPLAAAETTVYTYSVTGLLLSTQDPSGNLTTYDYNSYGDVITATDALGKPTSYTYDNNGNRKTVTDGNKRTTTYTYNKDNEVTQVLYPDSTHEDYKYDNLGRVISTTNVLGQTTTYAYNDSTREVTTNAPLSRVSKVSYDAVGNPKVLTDELSRTTTLSYNEADQLRNVHYSDPNTSDVTYDYDSKGLRWHMYDNAGTTTYGYDSLGRLTSVQDANTRTVGYNYDLNNNLTAITYPDLGTGTRTVTRHFNQANQMDYVQDWLNNRTDLEYDHSGNLKHIYKQNSTVSTDIVYNAINLPVGITHTLTSTAFLKFTYPTRDNIGLLNTSTESSTGSHTYGYDNRNHLTSDNITNGAQRSWTYDAAAEIKTSVSKPLPSSQSKDTTTGTYTYDAAGQFSSLVEKKGNTTTRNLSFTYSSTGNRTQQRDSVSAQTINYAYDQANRLTNYNSGVATYGYNGDGLRMSKVKSGTTEQYTWDVAEGLPLLLQDGGASYIYGPGGLLLWQIASNGQMYRYHTDQLGSVRAISSDATGQMLNTYNYDDYGNIISSSGSTYNPFGYAGEYRDSESGLIYLRARYYDPSTQQFLTRDPELAASGQAYAYAGGTPINLRDPSGKFPFLLVLAGIAVGALFGAGFYLGGSLVTGNQPTWLGALGAAAAGAIAGGVGVIAGPIAAFFRIGGVFGTAVVNGVAGFAGYLVDSMIDPGLNKTAGDFFMGVGLSAAFGALGGYLGSKIFPTRGMDVFGQVGFPRTLAGVLPTLMGGRVPLMTLARGGKGLNARNAIYAGGSISSGIASFGPLLVSRMMGPVQWPMNLNLSRPSPWFGTGGGEW